MLMMTKYLLYPIFNQGIQKVKLTPSLREKKLQFNYLSYNMPIHIIGKMGRFQIWTIHLDNSI